MHYILFYDTVDNFIERRTPFRTAHLKLVQKSFDGGELVLAGALSEPADGAVLVFAGNSPGAAETFARSDPYVVNGLVRSWHVRKWMTVTGDGSATS